MIIPNRFRRNVALDTSVLSDVLLNARSVEQFVDTVLARDANVVISKLVILELLSNFDAQKKLEQLQNLQCLFRRLRRLQNRIGTSPNHLELIKEETEGWLRGTPLYEWRWIEDAPGSELIAAVAASSPLEEDLRMKKLELLETDRTLSQVLDARGQALGTEAVIQAIQSNDHMGAFDMVIECAAELSGGRKTAAVIAADPRRFKAIHVLAHLTWRLKLANSVDRQKNHERALGLWRTKKEGRGEGTWYDLFIAGTSAYCDFFLSNDSEQRERCEFLRDRGLLTFRSIPLADFLAIHCALP